MAGLVDRLPMGGLALSIAVCLVVRSAVVAAHGQHEHLLRRRRRSRCGTRMTPTRTVVGLSRLLVLVPVTVCATISYFNGLPPRCNDRTPPPQTLALCKYDDDCIPNAFCWEQEACLCKDNYIVYRNRTHLKCVKAATAIGDPCETDIQCRVTFAPYSECRNGICQCSDGSHYVEGRCYESIGLGKSCLTSHNCYIKDSYCVTGFCTCGLNHHPNPKNDGCIESIELGEKCSYDYECVAENSRCIDVCTCKVHHVLSNDGKQCLKAANSVGGLCQEDSQCHLFLKDTKCDPKGRCNCIENYHQRGPVCYRDVSLTARCQTHRECVTETYKHSNFTDVMNVECSNGICSCTKDYTMAEQLNDCIRYSESGAARISTWQQILQVLSLLVLTTVLTH